MRTQNLQRRIERAEQAAKTQSKFSPDCICFPEKEAPAFSCPEEQQQAATVKCPAHGERFVPRLFIYVAKWVREKHHVLLERRSEQYRRAWLASFPPALCPTEEAVVGGKRVLRLRTGTVIRFL
jgi:predicted amidohydrolase